MKIPPIVVWGIGGGIAAILLVSLGVGIATYIGSGARNATPANQVVANRPPAAPAPARGGGSGAPAARGPAAPAPKAAAPAPAPKAPAAPVKAVLAPTLAPSDLLDQPGVVTGTLQTVNTNGVLTYLPLDAAPGTRPKGVVISKDTVIRLNGAPAAVSALKSGMDICFLAPENDLPLKKLETFTLLPDGKAHTKQGLIDAVSARSIVFLAGNSAIPSAVLTNPETVVTLDGQSAKLTDLHPQMMASVEFVDITAKAITASSTLSDGKPHKVQGSLVKFNDDDLVVRTAGNAGFDVKMKADASMKVVRETVADALPPHGGIGLGSWGTNVEYADVTVSDGDTALLQSDFVAGMGSWKPAGGTWNTTKAGSLTETGTATNCKALAGDAAWGDYTFSVRARKTAGKEGFLVLFHVVDQNNLTWWNIGGNNNTHARVETTIKGVTTAFGPTANVTVTTGRWYDIRIELKGTNIKCYLDDKLVTEATDTTTTKSVSLADASTADLKAGQTVLATYTDGKATDVTIKLPAAAPPPAPAPAPKPATPKPPTPADNMP